MKTRNIFAIVAGALTSVFILYVVLYWNYTNEREQEQVRNHGRVIASEMYAFESEGADEYFRLACKAYNYKHVLVTQSTGEIFIDQEYSLQGALDRFLVDIHLLPTISIESDVIFNEEVIGKIIVLWHNTAIYPYTYALILIFLLLIILWFHLRTVKANFELESRVEARTIDLRQEISERQQVAKALTASESFLNSVIDNIPSMVFVKDAKELRFVKFNKAGEDLLGYSREGIIGKTDYDLFPHEEAHFFTAKDREVLSEKRLVDVPEEPIQTKLKGSRILHTQKIPLLDEDGTPLFLLGISQDITEKKQVAEERSILESKLFQAQKMEVIGLMAGGVAHDLNNILAGVIGYPELLLQKLPPDSELRKPIEAIHDSGNRAALVVADLLTVARGAASTKEVHNLKTLTLEYLNSPEGEKLKSLYPGITIQCHFTATQPEIFCSSVHVKKCLMNLVINATEAITDSGKILISVYNQNVTNTDSAKQDLEEGVYAVLSIQDTGAGISVSDLEHIFEPFYTKKEMGRSGTGLGLTVVWNTMEEHNGKILVKRIDNRTCFQLYFPANKEEKEVNNKQTSPDELIGNNEHILVVDDEPQLRDIAVQMLRSMGYVTDSVQSGELAVEFIQEKPVDLIIIDMLMDKGINGRETYKRIQAIRPNQKAIVTSGFSESDDVKETLKLGASVFIKKPYSILQLGRAVKDALSG